VRGRHGGDATRAAVPDAIRELVPSAQSEQHGGGFTFGPPKSEAGYRTVAIPAVITPDLASHIVTFAASGDDGLVSTSSEGKPLIAMRGCGLLDTVRRWRAERADLRAVPSMRWPH
jgi:hypothetical protein